VKAPSSETDKLRGLLWITVPISVLGGVVHSRVMDAEPPLGMGARGDGVATVMLVMADGRDRDSARLDEAAPPVLEIVTTTDVCLPPTADDTTDPGFATSCTGKRKVGA